MTKQLKEKHIRTSEKGFRCLPFTKINTWKPNSTPLKSRCPLVWKRSEFNSHQTARIKSKPKSYRIGSRSRMRVEMWWRMCFTRFQQAKPSWITATEKTEHRLSRGPGYPLCLVARAKSQAVTYALLSTQTRFGLHICAVPCYSHILDLLHSWEEMRALNSQAILKILPTDFINK